MDQFLNLQMHTEALEKRVAELEAKWPPATHDMLVELFDKLRKARHARAFADMEINSVLAEIEAAALSIRL